MWALSDLELTWLYSHKEPSPRSQRAVVYQRFAKCETWSTLQSLDWMIWLRNRVMVVLSVPAWPNCFPQNLCWIKFEIRLSACFPVLMNSRQFVECGIFQNRGAGVTATSQPLFSRMLGCPDITDCPLHSESHQAILLSKEEGMARPVLCQTSRAYRIDLDFLLAKKFNLFLFSIHLNPSILILLFFSFAACWPSPDKKPWCFFGKESFIIVNWLRAVNSWRSLEFWVQPSE